MFKPEPSPDPDFPDPDRPFRPWNPDDDDDDPDDEKIRQWTKELTDKIDDTKRQEAWDLWLACYTEDEIAESIKVAQKTVNQWILAKKQELGKSIIFPESLQIYNIWSGIQSARTENEEVLND